ncbi:MAG TPA: DNA repair exonuclease [Longimicrobiaceae bacterium]|nr:DNA repair exonuclease [Longimicrobiaceae bacterium]
MSLNLRIAHLADLHLGFRAYHRSNARGINLREADVAEAFRQAVARVVELRPDLVLVAGDVFHTVRPSNHAIAGAFRQFSLLHERLPGVPVVMIAGNHDSPRSADTGNILNLFREIETVRVVCDEGATVRLPELDASVRCLPHVALATDPEPSPPEPDPKAKHNLLMLHAEVPSATADPAEHPTEYGGVLLPAARIGAERWEYVALGHHHLCEARAANMWYPGGIERTSVNIWRETGPKGFLLYDTETATAEFQPVETREMVDLPRLSAAGRSPAEVDALVRAAVEGIPGGVRGRMVRLILTDVPRAVVRELNHKQIREWKAEAVHFHLDARPPEVRRRVGSGAPLRRLSLREQVAAYLEKSWELSSPDLDRGRLVGLALEYVDRTGGEE